MAQSDLPARVRQLLTIQHKQNVEVIITASGPNSTFVPGKDDYDQETMALANAEAQGIIKDEETRNRYTIADGETLIKLNNHGTPAPIVDGAGGGLTFIKDLENNGTINAQAILDKSSNSGDFDFKVIKGKEVPGPNSKDYVALLGELNGVVPGEITKNVERILEQRNRFSENSPYIKPGQQEGDSGTTVGDLVIQKDFGKHNPTSSQEAKVVKLHNLKNLGVQMLLKSAGEHYIPNDTTDMVQDLLAKASSMAPGLARLGSKVPVSSFSPKKIMQQVNPEFAKAESSAATLTSTEILSYGSYNSPLVPFDSLDSRSSAIASTILVTTIIGIFEGLSRVLSPSALQSPLAQNLLNNINSAVTETDFDYTECVREGMAVFFGITTSGDALGAIGQNVLNAIEGTIGLGNSKFGNEAGYYNTVLRSLTRMVQYEVAQALIPVSIPGISGQRLGPFSVDSGLDISTPGLSKDVTNYLESFRRLTRSRIVGFMNVMAHIGDLSLSLQRDGLESNSGLDVGPFYETLLLNKDTFERDNLLANKTNSTSGVYPLAAVYKTWLSNDGRGAINSGGGNRTLAWSNKTTPSVFLLPSSIPLAASALGGAGADSKIRTKLNKDSNAVEADGRIQPEIVEAIENELEASYMPFYFHDLRTNEIISFHAFLENLSDNFNAEYSENSGYGRIGKTYTYKNTDRSIAFSFRAVATNPSDFDAMWQKINKLVTMVYPQYTAGRELTFEGQKFIQPFSQLPSASPMIRLRLGDVFTSNYGKFNLARLFGLGKRSFALNQQAVDSARDTIQQNNQIQIQKNLILQRMARNDFVLGDIVFLSQAPHPTVGSGGRGHRGRSRSASGAPAATFVPIPPGSSVTSAPSPANVARNRARRGSSTAGSNRSTTLHGPQRVRIININFDINNPDIREYTWSLVSNSSIKEVAGKYYVGTGTPPDGLNRQQPPLLTPDMDYVQRLATTSAAARNPSPSTTEQQTQIDDNSNVQAVKNFFDKNDNPIMKAFESSKGRGLAGFIRNISFDWNDSTWYTDGGVGTRAPWSCRIDISFAPIHDLNPGIDSDGYNTAPVYRIGDNSNATYTSIDGDDKATDDKVKQKYDELTNDFTNRVDKSRFGL